MSPDVHPGNLFLGTEDDTLFRKMEEAESTNPVSRKRLPDRDIYLSRLMKPKIGPLLLSDFGETRIGRGPHAGDIMPIQYRAPETLLWIQWTYAVDIWSVGLTVRRGIPLSRLINALIDFPGCSRHGIFSKGKHCSPRARTMALSPTELTWPNL